MRRREDCACKLDLVRCIRLRGCHRRRAISGRRIKPAVAAALLMRLMRLMRLVRTRVGMIGSRVVVMVAARFVAHPRCGHVARADDAREDGHAGQCPRSH